MVCTGIPFILFFYFAKIPSEIEVALRYKMLKLFTLISLVCTVDTVYNIEAALQMQKH